MHHVRETKRRLAMSDNKAVLQHALENWNRGNLDAYLEQLYDTNVILHGFPPGLPPGVAGARAFYEQVWAAFPNPQLTFEDVIEEGDKLAIRFTMRATHQGDFMGIAPTGKEINLVGITILHFTGGKVVERWNQVDMLGLMQQLSAQ
jgi:predicted ester cyclase